MTDNGKTPITPAVQASARLLVTAPTFACARLTEVHDASS